MKIILILCGIILLGGMILRIHWELHHFKVTEYTLKNRILRGSFRAVVAADLHCQEFGEKNQKLLDEIRRQKPDLLLIPGDLVICKHRYRTKEALDFLEEAVRVCPVYYSPGNHEERLLQQNPDFTEEVSRIGAVWLDNRQTEITVGENRITLAGLSLEEKYYGKILPGCQREELTQNDMEKRLGKKTDAFCILLAHPPDFLNAYARWGAETVFSGHNHGGIVRLPLVGGVISAGWHLFDRFDRGVFREEGTTMYVSAGLGTHTIKLRLGNVPELLVVNFSEL